MKAFFSDLKKDLLVGTRGNERQRKQFGLKSEEAIKIIDQFCQGDTSAGNQSAAGILGAPDK